MHQNQKSNNKIPGIQSTIQPNSKIIFNQQSAIQQCHQAYSRSSNGTVYLFLKLGGKVFFEEVSFEIGPEGSV